MLRIKCSAEKPPLRQAAKRWWQLAVSRRMTIAARTRTSHIYAINGKSEKD
ncbi:MAG: hypothetical protein LCH44_14975 [Bacteroidetes bacterium]|nr:hypothetical protein [Bacteroidota bacterium]